jgi:hypothetical protein
MWLRSGKRKAKRHGVRGVAWQHNWRFKQLWVFLSTWISEFLILIVTKGSHPLNWSEWTVRQTTHSLQFSAYGSLHCPVMSASSVPSFWGQGGRSTKITQLPLVTKLRAHRHSLPFHVCDGQFLLPYSQTKQLCITASLCPCVHFTMCSAELSVFMTTETVIPA